MQEGHIDAICISSRKGIVKHEIAEAVLVENFGIKGDAHAGDWHRQVSLLASESIARMKEALPGLRNGAFAENLIISGIDVRSLKIGDQLTIEGGTLLEVTQIGKECHNSGCAIKKATGTCIMPVEGVFTRVIRGGAIERGRAISVNSSRQSVAA
jgi:MOSC domain-containing protein YiiM